MKSPGKASASRRILITGGAGFIGSHLCERLLREGHRVICLDNFKTGNRKNIMPLFSNPRFSFMEQDVTCHISIRGSLDVVMHFASPASPVDYQEFPIPTLKAGSLGTHKTLGLAKEKKAVYFLASTSEVYGDPLVHPQKENYWGNVNPIGPRGVYDEAKRFAEAMTMAYHRSLGLRVRIARLFNTYGPRMRARDGRVVPNFIQQALAGKALTVYGDGTQTRSFCYIDDMIEGLLLLLEKNVQEPVNLGNPQEMSVKQFARLILKITGSRSRLIYKPLPVDDPRVRQPDISKARRLLKWSPATPLREGVAKTVAYFRAQKIK